jgi:glycosyltransferase involved in cell wall biosynthesis
MDRIAGLSACIITLNEEGNLAECLASLEFAEEIIVVDSGSTDGTRKVAERFGARWVHRQFDDYIQQKNFAIDSARYPWILFLDADERVSNGLRIEIRDLALRGTFGNGNDGQSVAGAGSSSPSDPGCAVGSTPGGPEVHDGYLVPRRTFYLGRWIRFGGWYPDRTIRLFRKEKGRFAGRTFHERVVVTGSRGVLKEPLLHFSYRSITDHVKVINRYSDLFARERKQSGRSNGVLFSVFKAFSKFTVMYIFKGGFLDGRAGLVIAMLGSYYNFLKYVKCWEASLSSKMVVPEDTAKSLPARTSGPSVTPR